MCERFIFSLWGVTLFRGRFGFCDFSTNWKISKDQVQNYLLFRNSSLMKCLENNGNWRIYPYNFENIYNAFLTLLIISSFDEWSSILQVAINSNVSDFVKTINSLKSFNFFFRVRRQTTINTHPTYFFAVLLSLEFGFS